MGSGRPDKPATSSSVGLGTPIISLDKVSPLVPVTKSDFFPLLFPSRDSLGKLEVMAGRQLLYILS